MLISTIVTPVTDIVLMSRNAQIQMYAGAISKLLYG